MPGASSLLLSVGLLGDFLLLSEVVVTRYSEMRLWPLEDQSWKSPAGWYNWLSVSLVSVSLAGLVRLRWNSLGVPGVVRLLGGVVLLAGAVLFAAAVLDIGVEPTFGIESGLHTEGIYSFTRNPQLLGCLFMLAGLSVASGSALVTLVATAAGVWCCALPRLEEPWLKQKFGRQYEEYCDQTPRFLGVRSFT